MIGKPGNVTSGSNVRAGLRAIADDTVALTGGVGREADGITASLPPVSGRFEECREQ